MSTHSDSGNRGVDPDPSALPTLKWGVIGIAITVLVILLCEVGFEITIRQQDALKSGMVPSSAAQQLKARQHAYIEQGLPDRSRISIESAMERVVDVANQGGQH